ncbi:MAG: hypothetical protein IPP02_09010 [Chitinophagaceae bacterium]|jgi:hypothetical protein|nr:hypothetical protein [Chitinophagaceae bacterium]MBK7677983.1 hypothetical protein [Chitinophagaceae bacterium]MBK8301298.1 hypothetical protein [Chitinophagaceae bacterium]MBK9466182.1 hypothetical protein [Chitinophagaceae bacterium]MBK9658372.1 hypothetical protein [Chitinophagaceae bacterium]
MKNKCLFTLSTVFLFFTTLNNPVSAQETQIDGKSYETIRKVNLNADADFVILKQKSTGTTNEESFIKVNNEYTKTSFTAAALKNFFTTGKLASLGTVKKSKIAGKSIIYIDKGSSIVIVSYSKEAIGFIDIQDEKTVLSARNSFAQAYDDNDPGGSTGDPFLDCGVDCLGIYISCGNSASCKSAYRECYLDCKRKYPSRNGSGNNTSNYIIPLNKLAVKL